MKNLHEFSDIHSHNAAGPDVITNLRLFQQPQTPLGSAWYSVGIHPWDIAFLIDSAKLEQALQWVESLATDPRVAAIGECGLDMLHRPAAPIELQQDIFLRQAQIALAVGKPLIIHCVRQWHRLLALAPQLSGIHCIIHGFRGKPELAHQLLTAGFDLSFGTRFNPDAFAATPESRRYHESDVDAS